MAKRLPTPGADEGNWGVILNDFLSESLDPANGSLKSGTVTGVQIASGAVDTVHLSAAVQAQLSAVPPSNDPIAWGTVTGALATQVDLNTVLKTKAKIPTVLGATEEIPANAQPGFFLKGVLNNQPDTVPSAPANLTLSSKTTTSVSLAWTASASATSYQVFRNNQLIGNSTTTTYTANGLADNTTYSFYVRAVNVRGASSPSAELSVTTDQDNEPAAATTATSLVVTPTNTAVAGTDVTLQISVTPTAPGTITLRDGSTTIKSLAITASTVSTTLKSLPIGSHSLSALFTPSNSLAFTGSTSNVIPYTITAPTGDTSVPSFETTTLGSNLRVSVAFSKLILVDGAAPITLAVTSGALPSGLSLNESTISGTPTVAGNYSFVLTATNANGTDTCTFADDIDQAPVTQVPAVPTGLNSSSKTQTSVYLAWTASAGATGYQIFRNGTSVGASAATSFNVTGLTSGTPYTFYVRATNAAGASGNSTSISVTTTAATPGSGGGIPSRVASFGPNGTHWPSKTPYINDTFVYDVQVDPTWSAIQAAIAAAPTSGNARIRVRPGTLPAGFGEGSTSAAVIQNVGSQTRPSRILVTPRDGYGSVVANSSNGILFDNVCGVTFNGFNFTAIGVNFRGCRNTALSRTTARILNIRIVGTSSATSEMEFVECVLPNQQNMEDDMGSIRLYQSGNLSVTNMQFIGCYLAPAYRAVGQDGHCDTWQHSRDQASGGMNNITWKDSILFQSTGQIMQLADTQTINFDHTAFIGGLRGTGRYPLASGRDAIVAQNGLWGSWGSASTLKDSVFMCKFYPGNSFASVQNTVTGMTPVDISVASGSFTINSQFSDMNTQQTAWLNTNSPTPTPAYLASIWN